MHWYGRGAFVTFHLELIADSLALAVDWLPADDRLDATTNEIGDKSDVSGSVVGLERVAPMLRSIGSLLSLAAETGRKLCDRDSIVLRLKSSGSSSLTLRSIRSCFWLPFIIDVMSSLRTLYAQSSPASKLRFFSPVWQTVAAAAFCWAASNTYKRRPDKKILKPKTWSRQKNQPLTCMHISQKSDRDDSMPVRERLHQHTSRYACTHTCMHGQMNKSKT